MLPEGHEKDMIDDDLFDMNEDEFEKDYGVELLDEN